MKLIKEICAVIILSTILGMVRFGFTSDDFTLIKKVRTLDRVVVDPAPDADSVQVQLPEFLSEPMMIDTPVAKYLHDHGDAIFIDARENEEYGYSHIPGAISIPYDYYEDYEHQLDTVDRSTTVVTYCGGGECDLSLDLGDYLFNDLGFSSVFVYDGGINLWTEEGFAVE